jgi:hypothetical protein
MYVSCLPIHALFSNAFSLMVRNHSQTTLTTAQMKTKTTKIRNILETHHWSMATRLCLESSSYLNHHPHQSRTEVSRYLFWKNSAFVYITKAPTPPSPSRTRSLSPSQLRKKNLLFSIHGGFHPPRSYTVEAICALPHPTPTHALASSLCMTHMLTGSDDGYIRDYDIFTAVNGKNFLTAPQRHHCGVVEGIMKSGQIRFWWENPTLRLNGDAPADQEVLLSPVYSLVMHSDALWSLAGSDVCSFCFAFTHLATQIHCLDRPYQSFYRAPRARPRLSRNERSSWSCFWPFSAA